MTETVFFFPRHYIKQKPETVSYYVSVGCKFNTSSQKAKDKVISEPYWAKPLLRATASVYVAAWKWRELAAKSGTKTTPDFEEVQSTLSGKQKACLTWSSLSWLMIQISDFEGAAVPLGQYKGGVIDIFPV